jgi:hypothetical protein
MNRYPYHHPPYHPPYPPPRAYPGLVDVAGGIIGLTAATLRGGARLVTTLVESTLWGVAYPGYGYGYPYGPCDHPVYHGYRVEYVPPLYSGFPPTCY